ncbi:polymorphic toxin-type HINT domain-containing protein [Niveibacterium sp. COAC-50]|uniref:polymorphic toxin-type HINT domain-containing protein n=1 Tax=Niveibacterium sp. COAC-50 TaxID=2729384 RepID=UPI001553CE03|nr:polymorphic toxin-type HINT domain-containing protein [Niveibacterium sp. COAC-50]
MNLVETGFAAGTLVHTKIGLKPIEDVSVGDLVLSFPDDKIPPPRLREEHEYTYRRVTAISRAEELVVCEVIAWDLANNIKETIKVTPNHPIYIQGFGWKTSDRIVFGNTLESNDFSNLLVKKRRDTQERVTVYALEVDEHYSYYVGELGVWVYGNVTNAAKDDA